MALRVPRWVLLSPLVKIAQGSLNRCFLRFAQARMLGLELDADALLGSDYNSLAEVAVPIFWLSAILLVDSTLHPYTNLRHTVI